MSTYTYVLTYLPTYLLCPRAASKCNLQVREFSGSKGGGGGRGWGRSRAGLFMLLLLLELYGS